MGQVWRLVWGQQPNDIFMVWTLWGEVRNVWLAGTSVLGFLQLKHLLGAGRHHTVLALACLSCDRKMSSASPQQQVVIQSHSSSRLLS